MKAIPSPYPFRPATERLVSEQPWYQGGYRANIVAYAIAKVAYDVVARAFPTGRGREQCSSIVHGRSRGAGRLDPK